MGLFYFVVDGAPHGNITAEGEDDIDQIPGVCACGQLNGRLRVPWAV